MSQERDIPQSFVGGNKSTASPNQIEQLEKLCKILEEVQKPSPEGSNFAKVGCVYNTDGTVRGTVFVSRTVVDGSNPPIVDVTYWLFVPGQPPVQNYQGEWEVCRDQEELIVSEVGCLADASSLDLEPTTRDIVTSVFVDGMVVPLNPTLPADWTVAELVAAVNAVVPGTLATFGRDTVVSTGDRAVVNFHIVNEQSTEDQIRVRSYVMEPRGWIQSVEIIKTINRNNGDVKSIRVFTPDGQTEFVPPYASNVGFPRILTVGACYIPTRSLGLDAELAAKTASAPCVNSPARGIQTSWSA